MGLMFEAFLQNQIESVVRSRMGTLTGTAASSQAMLDYDQQVLGGGGGTPAIALQENNLEGKACKGNCEPDKYCEFCDKNIE